MIVKSTQKKQVIDITDKIQKFLENEDAESGLLNLFVKHTTCALTTADLDPGTDKDYLRAFEELTPKLKYTHPHNPRHFPDHFLSSAVGTSLNIPVEDGQLQLGTWQKVVLLEFNGPRDREVLLTFIASSA